MKDEPTGVLPLWKPRGMTSFKAVQEVKKIFYTKKAGHTGTLDPDVDGVLPICLGRATKIVEYLTADKKEYVGEVTIGSTTTTEDASGEIIEEKEVGDITVQEVKDVLTNLHGTITQTPPMYSAVKVKGKKLYEYAREGITVERPTREIEIFDLSLQSEIQRTDDGKVKFSFKVSCSKGTYVRTLSVTIGKMLGYPAHMSDLVRTASGMFLLENCITLDDLAAMSESELQNSLLTIETALSNFPKKIVDPMIEEKVMNGAILPQIMDESMVALYNQKGECLALYRPHPKRVGMMKPAKMIKTVQ